MRYKRIGQIAIRSKDMEASAGFYREVMGLKEAFRLYNKETGACGSIHMFVAPNSYIEIFPNGQKDPRGDHLTEIGLNHFCLEVENLAETVEELRAKGAPIDVEPKTGNSKCILAWTHDIDGNRIELMELPEGCMQHDADKKVLAELSAEK